MEAEPGPSVKSAQPIRSDERQRDEAPRPIEAEESARPERGTVIRTGPKLVRLQNVASGKLKKKVNFVSLLSHSTFCTKAKN